MFCRFLLACALGWLSISAVAQATDLRDVTYNTQNAGRVVFSHNSHIKSKEADHDCKVCHDSIFSMKKKSHYTMADMEKGKSCGACHEGSKAFALKECSRCHQVKEISYAVKSTGTTLFSHAKHLESTPDCAACHPRLFNAGKNKRFTMAEMDKGRSCGACHNGKQAFSVSKCAACHPVKDKKYEVAGAGAVMFEHAVHMGHNKCDKCHNALYSHNAKSRLKVSMKAMEKGKSCGACHNGKKAFSVSKCAACHPIKDKKYEVAGAGAVMFEHAVHTGHYKCNECHNALYRHKAYGKVKVSMKAMEKGKSCGACHNGKIAFSVKENCATCHKAK